MEANLHIKELFVSIEIHTQNFELEMSLLQKLLLSDCDYPPTKIYISEGPITKDFLEVRLCEKSCLFVEVPKDVDPEVVCEIILSQLNPAFPYIYKIISVNIEPKGNFKVKATRPKL